MGNKSTEKTLKGYTIVDFTTNISGPSATAILSDLGANVIKIEKTTNGDDSRSMEPSFNGKSAYFVAINRGKTSLAIDIKSGDGRKIIEELIRHADIMVENYRKSTIESLKLDYPNVKKINNKIIYASIRSYGTKGPFSNKPGYDAIIQAETGIMSVNGNRNGKPSRVGVSVLDAGSAMWLSIGILNAIINRERTGEGSQVSTSLYETGLYWMNYYIQSYQITGNIPKRSGSEHMAFAPYGAFAAKDGYIMIGISNDNLFSRMCDALSIHKLANDSLFKTNKDRVKNRKKLNRILNSILIKQSKEYWIKKLSDRIVPCSAIKNVKEVLESEQTIALNPFQKIKENNLNLKIQSIPIEINGKHLSIDKSSPALGEDTLSLLLALGYNNEYIQRLKSAGTIKDALIN